MNEPIMLNEIQEHSVSFKTEKRGSAVNNDGRYQWYEKSKKNG